MKIASLLVGLSIPSIIAMLTNAIYNLVDTFFIGRIGTSAVGAVAVAFPIFNLIGAVGLTYGVGAASYVSRLLGAGEKEQADKAASTALFTSLATGIAFALLGLMYLDPLLTAFGATETIMEYAREYTMIIIMGSIFTMMNMTMNNLVRAEGNAQRFMVAMVSGALLNVALDPIFIFGFGMGIKGAAVATVISQSVSTVIILEYFVRKKSFTNLSIRLFRFSLHIYSEIFKIGLPTFLRQFLSSFSVALLNNAAGAFGDHAVAAVGITMRVLMLGMMVLFGYGQAFQPVAGYNYGAKKFSRVFESLKFSILVTTVFATLFAIIGMVIPGSIVSIFSNDPEVIDVGSRALRAVSIFFPSFGFVITFTVLFQALGKGFAAGLLSMSKQGLFLIPAIIVLPRLFELNGVIYAQTIADFFTLFVAAILAMMIVKKLKAQSKELSLAD
ncbi:MAG: Multi antimicrobial extrusion protein (Na(+)/drug antiporter), MATE family of MDR efflux pump [Mesotoga infera]|nr:MAG: Multi antimicrobial extrusion protein (Na(+)/drug antiporter), MATE family of MDR efflux pump [Mesotoga infera]